MKVAKTVIVTDPKSGHQVVLLAGREAPAWVVPLLTSDERDDGQQPDDDTHSLGADES